MFRYLLAIAAFAALMLAFPPVADALSFATPRWQALAIAGATESILLLVFELAKRIARRFGLDPAIPASTLQVWLLPAEPNADIGRSTRSR